MIKGKLEVMKLIILIVLLIHLISKAELPTLDTLSDGELTGLNNDFSSNGIFSSASSLAPIQVPYSLL